MRLIRARLRRIGSGRMRSVPPGSGRLRSVPPRSGLARACTLVLGLLCSLLVLTATPAHAEETACVRGVPGVGTPDTDPDPDARDGANQVLRLAEVHRIATGRGVGVAVIDSGIVNSPRLRLEKGNDLVPGRLLDGHGSVVAGLINGSEPATGIAPGATVYDLRVAASRPDEGGSSSPQADPDLVAQAVRWAIANRDRPIDVVHISVGFAEPHTGLADAIRDAVAAGLVVVAPAGDRPSAEQGMGMLEGDADAALEAPDEVLFPASMEGVLGVTTRDAELAMTTPSVLVGPGIDVSAPVVGLRSVMLQGLLCRVSSPSSAWAAAVVSGVVALLLEQDPALTPAQVRTRIEATAQGGMADSATDGHGMVQPLAALTRVLDIAPDGTLGGVRSAGSPDYVAAEPMPMGDGYAEERRTLLWWGLGAGGVLLLAVVLRPLLARRRD